MTSSKHTALITGSGRNIGRACAKELARQGFNIVINGSTKRHDCERVADEVRAIGTDVIIAMADIGDKAAVSEMAQTALKSFGRIDALIANAAIRPSVSFLEITDAQIERVFNVNTNSVIWLAQAFLPGMIENRWGRIITFSGMNSMQGKGRKSHVAMSKHANLGLCRSLAREFGANGITANTISPGTFPDEDEDINASTQYQSLLAQTPVGRLGEHDDIAAMVGLVCSDRGGFINGQLIRINGGVVG